MKDFNDKIIVVTGAGSGMGRAYAMEFAKRGARLALNDYDEKILEETASLVKTIGNKTVYCETFDVSNENANLQFANNVKKTLGCAHIVINNAGIEGGALPVYALNTESFRRVMDINFYGVLYGSKAFLPHLVQNNEGALVNVSSIFGLVGTPSSADYCASKFAVRGFTEALMAEFSQSPIQIHCVHPGGINTNIARSDESQAFSHKYLNTPPEEIVQHVIRCIQKNKSKIVYGQDARKTWLGANLVPQKWLTRLIWRDMKDVIEKSHYDLFIKE